MEKAKAKSRSSRRSSSENLLHSSSSGFDMRPLEYDDDSDVIDADDSYHDELPPPPPPPTGGLVTVSSTIDPDSEYVKSTRANATKDSKHRWRMELASILLFILGSVLFLVCAVYDYQWSQTLLTLPEWLRGVDDDELWMRYRLEERYGDVSTISAPSERKLGGVRRRLMRERHWGDDVSYNYDSYIPERKLQQTPEELYYDLDWECLPADIQAAYQILGYNQNSWDNELEVATDTMDWVDLTTAQQEAALYIGYTEMIWCEYDDAWDSTAWDDTVLVEDTETPTHGPSFKPTLRPTSNPTAAPTTSLLPTIKLSSIPSMAASQIPSFVPSSSSKPSTANFITTPDGSMVPRPTVKPTSNPTTAPSLSPTTEPSPSPSDFPSSYPSTQPSVSLSYPPSASLSTTDAIELESEFKSPEELYGDEWWRDLPPVIQEAFAILGWNEATWDAGDESISPPSEDMDWADLTPEMQAAASLIGYTQQTWDADDLNEVGGLEDGMIIDGINDDSATTDADYYEDYDWVELPPNVQEAAMILGWNQALWDSVNGTTWSEDVFWDELPDEAQKAAAVFGYNEASWNANGDANLESLLIAAGGKYVSSDDDYLFEVGPSNFQVSEYQVLYFFASSCFLLLGLIDLAREQAPFHLLMVLAGAFGVASAVFIEEDIHLSNILDCISVHLFLFEGIGLLSNSRHRELVHQEKWTKWSIIFADSQFLLGAILDVVLAYFYLFDNTVDWDTTLVLTWLFSAVLWVSCALIYLGVFLYEQQSRL